jgi:peptidylprolyl isomerase
MPRRLALLFVLALAACGGESASPPEPTPTPFIEKVTGEATPLPEVTPSGKREPKVSVPEGDPPAELVVRDLERGDGPEAVPGKTLAVDYKGVRWEDGEAFDSSWSTGQPFQFILGARQVIPGWERGFEGMRVGGRRQLIVPPELAYGDHGQGLIRPNETIVFVVDLLSVR